MEEEWVVKRCQLRQMWLDHPEWSRQKMADEIGCSKSWVKKWLRRIRSVPLEDQQVMYGLSRAPKQPPPRFSPEIVNKILEIRDQPPRLLGRTPGPLTILYYLHQDQALEESGVRLPRSTRSVWKILTQHQRIYHAAAYADIYATKRPSYLNICCQPAIAMLISRLDYRTAYSDPAECN